MDIPDRHRRAMAEFDQRVRLVPEDRWHVGTPCEEWDARALTNHVVVEQLWVPHLMAGATLAEVGDRYDGDQLGDDPASAWAETARAAQHAVTEPGALDVTVHTSMGEIPAEEYLLQLTLDLAVHAWDLARAVSLDEQLDPELVEDLYRLWSPRSAELAASGVFAAPVELSDDADVQMRLLALTGRDPRRR